MNNLTSASTHPVFLIATLCALLVAAAACAKPADEAVEGAEAQATQQSAQATSDEETPDESTHVAGHDETTDDHTRHSASEAGGGAAGMEHVVDDYEASEVVLQPNAAPGDLAQCPVSGEVFRVTEEHAWIEHGEGRVYFCCAGCIRRFQREPARWLATQNVAPGAPGEGDAAE